MDEVQPALLSQLFERPARQLLAEAIEIVECRVRPGGPYQDGRLIGPETKLLDALAQRSSLDQQAGNRRHQNRKTAQNGGDDEGHRQSWSPGHGAEISPDSGSSPSGTRGNLASSGTATRDHLIQPFSAEKSWFQKAGALRLWFGHEIP